MRLGLAVALEHGAAVEHAGELHLGRALRGVRAQHFAAKRASSVDAGDEDPGDLALVRAVLGITAQVTLFGPGAERVDATQQAEEEGLRERDGGQVLEPPGRALA